jgi:spore maturation protein CgeB
MLSELSGKGFRLLDRVYGRFKSDSIEVLMDKEIEKHIKVGKKIILYVTDKYDYGNKSWGLSYTYYNCYHTLLNMDYSLICFDTDRIKQKYGKEIMSQMLRETVYCYQPDILFYFHSNDWIDHEIWKEISGLPTKTIYFQSDDHHQYEKTRYIWELFNFVVTTDEKGYGKRTKEGFKNVISSQYACNHFMYKNMNLPRIYDVSFMGRCYGERQNFINTIRDNGIDIKTFGMWWGKLGNSNRITQSELLRIYNQSKISLDLSLASVGKVLAVKGRCFEATGCGSLLLTEETDEIKEYFIPNEEIVTYKNVSDATEKIKYYLTHEDERLIIAKRGYERTSKEHTWEKRFTDIFSRVLSEIK